MRLLLSSLLLSVSLAAYADSSAIAPKLLFSPRGESAGVIANPSRGVTAEAVDDGIAVTVDSPDEGYPGFAIAPSDGSPWNLSPWGHVEVTVRNTGDKAIYFSVRVDNPGDWKQQPWNTESGSVKPGETKTVPVYFGYQYGYKPADYQVRPEEVSQVLMFLSKDAAVRRFVVEEVKASGFTGEKPPVEPHLVVTVPGGGIVLGPKCRLDPAAKVEGPARREADGSYLVGAPAGQSATVRLKPDHGSWNLGEWTDVAAAFENLGAAPVSATIRAKSRNNQWTDLGKVEGVAPGAKATVTRPFAPDKFWVGEHNGTDRSGRTVPGTGTSYESHRTAEIELVFTSAEPLNVALRHVGAVETFLQAPEWLGKRPPVPGDWKLTLDENFDGDTIDLRRWNIYTSNYWDGRTHFTKTNNIVRGGKLTLRYTRDKGFQNDNPNDRSKVSNTGYACGYADTYGKWTQRYGYFEARMKLPRASGLWPAFWTMPDRGEAYTKAQGLGPEFWHRNGTGVDKTGGGGMEFDIMEHLTAWGPHRFNIACHWDGYGKEHKSVGSGSVYVNSDKDGYMTIGMLWLPGEFHLYSGGREFARWISPRVSDVPAYLIFYMVSGGWANTPLDPSRLPDEFVVDYVRAWQRADLATAGDGPKANDGHPGLQLRGGSEDPVPAN